MGLDCRTCRPAHVTQAQAPPLPPLPALKKDLDVDLYQSAIGAHR
jgi:hypothetical protein